MVKNSAHNHSKNTFKNSKKVIHTLYFQSKSSNDQIYQLYCPNLDKSPNLEFLINTKVLTLLSVNKD